MGLLLIEHPEPSRLRTRVKKRPTAMRTEGEPQPVRVARAAARRAATRPDRVRVAPRPGA